MRRLKTGARQRDRKKTNTLNCGDLCGKSKVETVKQQQHQQHKIPTRQQQRDRELSPREDRVRLRSKQTREVNKYDAEAVAVGRRRSAMATLPRNGSGTGRCILIITVHSEVSGSKCLLPLYRLIETQMWLCRRTAWKD